MNLPFTTEQFLDIFVLYNNAIWPFQFVLSLAALLTIVLAVKRYAFSDKTILITLSFFWLWMGIVYHMMFFTRINLAAFGFGSLFVVQGLLFLWHAWKGQVTFQASFEWRKSFGTILLLYAFIAYPYIGMRMGHLFPASPSFGAPCPTTIFTFGVLLWSANLPRYMLIIPGLWSVIGFTAALTLGIKEDIGLLVAGIIAITILGMAKPRQTSGSAA